MDANVQKSIEKPTLAIRPLLGLAPSGERDTIARLSNTFSTFKNMVTDSFSA